MKNIKSTIAIMAIAVGFISAMDGNQKTEIMVTMKPHLVLIQKEL